MKRILFGFFLLGLSVQGLAQNELPVPDSSPPPVRDSSRFFERVEIEASYPSGDAGWRKYMSASPILPKAINYAMKKGLAPGQYTVIVKFIVDPDGNVNAIVPETYIGYGFEEAVVKLISKSGKWNPAVINGRKVSAYRKQPVVFMIAKE
jgi:protein TonB